MTVRWVGLSAIFVYSPNSGDFLKRREARREWEEALREAVAAGTPPPVLRRPLIRSCVCLFVRSLDWLGFTVVCMLRTRALFSVSDVDWLASGSKKTSVKVGGLIGW